MLDDSGPGFVVLTAFDATAISADDVAAFARKLLRQGCVCACCWGRGASGLENAFDLEYVDAKLAGAPYPEFVMTTSHEDESLDEALWFAIFLAYPEVEVTRVLVIAEPAWADQIELRLTDSETLWNLVE